MMRSPTEGVANSTDDLSIKETPDVYYLFLQHNFLFSGRIDSFHKDVGADISQLKFKMIFSALDMKLFFDLSSG